MLEIIAHVGNPIMLRAYRTFTPGQIVKLVRTHNDVYCSLSNSVQPFGIVIGAPDQFDMVPILFNSASLLKTDNFEPGLEYPMGSLLYSSEAGVFTSKKSRINSVPVAYVENELKAGNKILEIRWI